MRSPTLMPTPTQTPRPIPTPTLTPALNHESCPSSSSEYQPSGYCMLLVFMSLSPSAVNAPDRARTNPPAASSGVASRRARVRTAGSPAQHPAT
uniref:Uncharacterized protein n=1 Tax=Arundo donax TaxID=35708 RepID=A0A0A9EW36_ARUDO